PTLPRFTSVSSFPTSFSHVPQIVLCLYLIVAESHFYEWLVA
ncbi:hypothetical protein ISN45_Aa06g032270, partial [Arabidopsis thaliana x Arabidopsis arenosa]